MLEYTKGGVALSLLFLATFGVGLYFLIAGDPSTGRSWAHLSIALGYTGLFWEVAVRLHRTCPLRKILARRHGPTILD
jgi:hypothetical protein